MKTIYAIYGKSCSGKNYVLNNNLLFKGMNVIVPYTTRPQRENEIDGKDYHFVSKEEINKLPSLCRAEYNDWCYAHALHDIKEGDNVGIFSLQAIKQLQQAPYNYNIKYVHVTAAEDIRKERFKSRGDKDDGFIAREKRDKEESLDIKDFLWITNNGGNFTNYIINATPTGAIDDNLDDIPMSYFNDIERIVMVGFTKAEAKQLVGIVDGMVGFQDDNIRIDFMKKGYQNIVLIRNFIKSRKYDIQIGFYKVGTTLFLD